MDKLSIYVIAVVFAASLIRSSLGFGEALVAVPLLALRIPVRVAAPLAVLVSITVAAIALVQDDREVELRSASWLVVATLAGIPLGLWLLISADEHVVKALLGAVIAIFAAQMLFGRTRTPRSIERRSWLLGCGLVAGVLGGAYGMNGPPLAIYGALRGWSAPRFRATLQAYFLPASALGMVGYALAGLWTPTVTHDFALVVPAVLVATLLGRWVNRSLDGRAFTRAVYVGLLVIGAVLLAQSL